MIASEKPRSVVKTEGPRVQLEYQGRVCKLSVKGRKAVAGGRRGRVSEFSQASRRRMIEKCNRIDLHQAFDQDGQRPKFLTLTYGREYPSPGQAKSDLFTFFKRIKRRYPGASAIWRIELQERGAPHFHVMFFGLPYVAFLKVQRMWAEVIGWDLDKEKTRAPFVRIEVIKSMRQLINYVAKYCAKVGEGGGSGPLLDTGTYLTAEGHVGRWWGVFNRGRLPLGRLVEIGLYLGKWVWKVKRIARRIYKRQVKSIPGFTLYLDGAARLFDWSWCVACDARAGA